MLQCSKRGAVASEEKIMIAKNKSRKSPKTAVIAPSTRSANSPERRAGAKISVVPGHDAPLFSTFAIEDSPFAAEELDTVTRSGLALADGIQAFGQALIEMQWRSVSAGLLAARGLVDARNPRDVIGAAAPLRRGLARELGPRDRPPGPAGRLPGGGGLGAPSRCGARSRQQVLRGRQGAMCSANGRQNRAERHFLCAVGPGSLRWRLRSNIMGVMKPLIFRWIDDVAG